MESLGKYKTARPRCIANNMEKYISFSIGNLSFIDSMQFMNTSLEKLVKNLSQEGLPKFRTLSRHYADEEELRLLTQKGVYPYDYMNNVARFSETSLPPIEAFYSKLTDEEISQEQYQHACNVWRKFNIANLGEYHDLYMKSDVLLLADVFENFRDVCLSCYKLDPAHFYTSPGLSMDALLKLSKIKLELLTDYDMHLMIESGIRGGVSMIANKYAKANNVHLPDYDESKASSFIMYYDANNLYGWAMSQPLPTGNFHWLSEAEIAQLDIMSVSVDSDTGYFLEVDLEYPTHLHDVHSDYPLASEVLTVTDDMLSPYSIKLKSELEIKGAPSAKLVPNLRNKSKYVLHYRNLQFYVSKGLCLTKIHRVIGFDQSRWMKPYIDFNTEKRTMAKSSFEKDFYKLMNNSVFGKTMENKRKRSDIQLVNNEARMKKLVSKPSFKSFRIFNEDLAGVHMLKTNLVLDKPIYVGAAVLDLSKILMYEFHYNYVVSKYGANAKLLFTDTDSLCYEIQTGDVYKDMFVDRYLYDTSDYDVTHYLYSTENKKVIGKMKDECCGKVVEEFVGLRSKMYSLLYEGEEKKTAKGIKKV